MIIHAALVWAVAYLPASAIPTGTARRDPVPMYVWICGHFPRHRRLAACWRLLLRIVAVFALLLFVIFPVDRAQLPANPDHLLGHRQPVIAAALTGQPGR